MGILAGAVFRASGVYGKALLLAALVVGFSTISGAEEKHPFLLNDPGKAPYDKERVARYFSSGNSIDIGIACSVLRRSALAGNHDAAMELYRRYRHGDVLPQDNLKTVYWNGYAFLIASYNKPEVKKYIDQTIKQARQSDDPDNREKARMLLKQGVSKAIFDPELRASADILKILKELSSQDFREIGYWFREDHPPLC